MSEKPEVGSITWFDLTVPNAEEVKDFYSKVVGWNSLPVSMGNYNDFNMNSTTSGNTKAGICHTHGTNSEMPAQWMIYIVVEDVDKSAEQCKKLGGKVITGPKSFGSYGRFCVIEDPTGAVCAIYTPS
jgi:predicted enzyme related to lactoylglutathione lyase